MSLQEIQKAIVPDDAAAGAVPVVAGAEAEATQSQTIAATANHLAKPSQAPPQVRKRKSSVAVQQKKDGLLPAPAGMFPSVDYTAHTDEELHKATVAAIGTYKQKREEADAYAYDVLIPALNQIIQRYKQQGRGTSYRLNGCPTVEEYFESIGLNYSTVRSWKSRAQQRLLQASTDAGTKPAPGRTSDRDPVPHFKRAERKALIKATTAPSRWWMLSKPGATQSTRSPRSKW